MSGFAAVFRFDGAPADGAALAAMTEAIAYRGPDGISDWAEGSAAISHLMLHTTAEALEETQPLGNKDERHGLAADRWVRNFLIYMLKGHPDPINIAPYPAFYAIILPSCSSTLIGSSSFMPFWMQ